MSTNIGFDKTYVINLKSRQKRRDEMEKTLRGLDYEVVDAIDGQKLKVRKLIKDGLLNTEYYDPNGVLTRNIIGCSLSHIKAWKKFLKSGLDTCLILEDDIFLTREIVRNQMDPEFGKPRIEFQTLLDEINSLDEWDVIFLGKKTQEIWLNRHKEAQEQALGLAKGGRAGYRTGRLVDEQVSEVEETPQGIRAVSENIEEEVPASNELSFGELRGRLPPEVTDDIINLIVQSPSALVDFAEVQTQSDVDNFNAKYGVNLVLPSEA